MNAKHIVKLLKDKHFDDIFVTELLTESLWFGKPVRFDVWTMYKSWKNPYATGYEIKVSRSDFLGDDKWQHYLNHCHRFSFVCPKGMIKKEELPDEVGLIYATDTGLHTVRPAKLRKIQLSGTLMHSALMRANGGIAQIDKEGRARHWADFSSRRSVYYAMAPLVAKRMKEYMKKELEKRDGVIRMYEKMLHEAGKPVFPYPL